MKILYVTTISITMNFFIDHIKMLIDEGHEVELACNCDAPVPDIYIDWGCKVRDIKFSRNPFSKDNIKAYKALKRLVESEKYDIVHTHTPNASFYTRIACKRIRKRGLTKVFYTAHGFHFYKGASLKNWMIYYTAEKLCSYFTDVLITINTEDYILAKKKMKAGKIEYVPGVGIDLNKFKKGTTEKATFRNSINVPSDSILLLSVGELNGNKNHETVLRALAMIKNQRVHYAIAGRGDLNDHLKQASVELGILDRVHLLGFRKDVSDLYDISDIFVFPSFREGLSVSLMEAMAKGKPCVVSKIRGNTDLIDDNGGALFNPKSHEDCKLAIEKLLYTDYERIGQNNVQKVINFSNDSIIKELKKIYNV